MNIKRSLATGAWESALLTELERAQIPVLSLPRHRAVLTGFDDERLRHTLAQLAAKGWLLRIEAGKYVVVPRAARGSWQEHPFIIAAAIAPEPSYISYWSALSYHNLTEQLPRGVFVVTTGHRKRPLTFQGWRYRFVTRTAAAFFGYGAHEMIGLNGAARVEVAIADPEKAIVDALDAELLAGGMAEVIKAIRRGFADDLLSLDRLTDYTLRYPNKAVVARLGYILTQSHIAGAQGLATGIRRDGYSPYLSTSGPREGISRDPVWHLLVNVPADAFEDVA